MSLRKKEKYDGRGEVWVGQRDTVSSKEREVDRRREFPLRVDSHLPVFAFKTLIVLSLLPLTIFVGSRKKKALTLRQSPVISWREGTYQLILPVNLTK